MGRVIAALLAVMLLVPGGVVAQDDEQAAAELTAAVLGDELTEQIHARVLGLYLDEESGEYVVVVPSTGDIPSAEDYSEFGLPVRIEQLDLTLDERDTILAAVRARAREKDGPDCVGFSFDARKGRVVVNSTAPRSLFASLLDEYPDRIEYEAMPRDPGCWGGGGVSRPAGLAAQDRETRDVCLEVTAIDSLTTAEVAAHVMGGTADVVGPGDKCRDEPLPIIAVPRDDLVDVREASWYRIEVQPDGRTLDVYYVNGVEDCFGLDRIEVAATESGLDVRVFTGDIPQPEGAFCILPALLYVTTVELDEPVIVGGRQDAG